MTAAPHSPLPVEKTCTKCGLTKPVNEFYISRANRDGRTYQCKSCIARYHEVKKACRAEEPETKIISLEAKRVSLSPSQKSLLEVVERIFEKCGRDRGHALVREVFSRFGAERITLLNESDHPAVMEQLMVLLP